MSSINILGVPQTQNAFSVLENKTVMIHDLTAPLVNSTEQTNLQWLKSFNEAPIEITYADFYSAITNNQLITGFRYVIIDFQTIYDQMDFDASGNLKSSLTTKTGAIEEIWVLALAPDRIASTAYSKTYPNDRIQYDWTYNTTLVNGSQAKGRISERIDEWNNRTDYDHREIKFIRYDDGSGNFTVINDNGNASAEFLTFGSNYGVGGIIYDNWLGDFYSIGQLIGQEYSNNVFHGGFIVSNKAGSLFYNNTFSSDFVFNKCEGDIGNNIIYGVAFYNTLNSEFRGNVILGQFSSNIINSKFTFNNANNIDAINCTNGGVSSCIFNSITGALFSGDVSLSNFSGDILYCNFYYEFTNNIINNTNAIKYCSLYSINNKTIDEATYPFLFGSDYKKEIFEASNGNNYIRYFNGLTDAITLIP